MKTMFRAEANTYTDCEGRYTEWKAVTEWVIKEEAMNATENIARSYSMTGDWSPARLTRLLSRLPMKSSLPSIGGKKSAEKKMPSVA